MKRKLIILSLTLVLAMTLAGGATFALFTDQASNQESVVTAGTVDIDSYRDGFDTVPGPMFYTTAD
ncbi:MAG: TasA family protein, partial [Syntrophomonadaceae bacterium]|nr:TasA family protein [Syntrophomonadaceae bacterium]